MAAPSNVTELRRFLGMVNQLGKFSSHISELTQPLRELLSSKNSWTWGLSQERAFSQVKAELAKPTVLALYDPQAPTKVSSDASSYGLGAVLLQQVDSIWRPVAYASRSMSETERRYAQIEKEALAVTWACDKFAHYVLGRSFQIETDHKPLVPLLSTKQLNNLPPRVLRFRLRLARYDYRIQHVPGKLPYTADALSRAPQTEVAESLELQEEVESFIESISDNLPVSRGRLEMYQKAQSSDSVCSRVREFCTAGWPKKHLIGEELLPYWKVRNSLSLHNGLLLYNSRIVVPPSLREETMDRIHEGHQGIERCRARTNSSVWWPGVSQSIAKKIQNCTTCAKDKVPKREPLLVTPLPDHPWQMVGTDLFELSGEHYLLVVDYFSRFPEIARLTSTTSAAVITSLKSIFARHGIPQILRSDNGPQYVSHEFSTFAKSYGFQHTTSSPRYPQSNGQAERTVKTVKQMLKQAEDPYLALLNYRATPLPWCKRSPAELSMGRKLRTRIPQLPEQLTPTWSYMDEFRKQNQKFKAKQKRDYDKRHRTKESDAIPDGSTVWITSEGERAEGTVISPADSPRSYLVDTPAGTLRRNRQHLNVAPWQPDELTETQPEIEQNTESTRRIMTRSQTGTELKPPERLYA